MSNIIYVGKGPIYIGDYNQDTGEVENEVKIVGGNRVLIKLKKPSLYYLSRKIKCRKIPRH